MTDGNLARADLCEAGCMHAEAVKEAQDRLKEDRRYVGLAELFGALADVTRAKIVHLLAHQELCTCDIAAALGVTESRVSQHLRVLRSLRLVRSRREGKFVHYTLDDAHVALLVQVGLTHQGHGDDEAIASALGSSLGRGRK